MKKCSSCGEVKETTEFHKKTASRDGLHPVCKKCKSKESKERKDRHLRKAVEYKGDKCQRCGTSFPDWMYDFHHVVPSEKEHGVGTIMRHNWQKIQNEIDKCELLCPNCHRQTHHEMRNGIG